MGEEEIGGSIDPPKLPQTDAILEAIIKSKKALPIELESGRGFSAPTSSLTLTLQGCADALVPWKKVRWISFATCVAAFLVRVVTLERHFFVAYMLSIYVLNQFILFLSPAMDDDELEAHPPSSAEYKPFVRAMSEFQFWLRSALFTMGAFVATFVEAFDLDVDGRVLMLYFTVLFLYTMKQQVFHMIRYSYVPWSGRKPRAKLSKADRGLDV